MTSQEDVGQFLAWDNRTNFESGLDFVARIITRSELGFSRFEGPRGL